MRRRDKLKNIEQANIMLEQAYLKSKGVLKENNNHFEEAENAISNMTEIGDVFKYLFNSIKGRYKENLKDVDDADYKLKIQKGDRFVDIELDRQEDHDNEYIVIKFTDGDDNFNRGIVKISETGGEKRQEDQFGGSYETYDDEGVNFELDVDTITSVFGSIDGYLTGKVDYLE